MLRGQTQGASSPNQGLLPDLAQEIPAIHHAASRQFSLQGAPVHTQDTRRFREVAASGAQCAEDLFPFELDQTSSSPCRHILGCITPPRRINSKRQGDVFDMRGLGLSWAQLEELRDAVALFRASGKPNSSCPGISWRWVVPRAYSPPSAPSSVYRPSAPARWVRTPSEL